jgi:hypothetical protein
LTKKAHREFGGRIARNSWSRITFRWQGCQTAVLLRAIATDRAVSSDESVCADDSAQVEFTRNMGLHVRSSTSLERRHSSNPKTPFFTNQLAVKAPRILRKKSHFFMGSTSRRPIGV